MSLSSERREAPRYPVAVEAEYRLNSEEKYSRGLVRNLSNTGLLLDCDPAVKEGRAIELLIQWPAFQGKVKLYAAGQTVRAGEGCTGVRIENALFRFDG
jgi:hypothetical protein